MQEAIMVVVMAAVDIGVVAIAAIRAAAMRVGGCLWR